MEAGAWIEEFPAPVTVCDERGVIVALNAAARKLIHQSPWYRKGRFAGYVELSIVLPERMEHRVRQR